MYDTISNWMLIKLIKVKYENYDKYDFLIREILCEGITAILCTVIALTMGTVIETITAAVIIVIIGQLTPRKHAHSLERCTIYSTFAISGIAYIAVYLQNYITVALAMVFAGIISLIFIEH